MNPAHYLSQEAPISVGVLTPHVTTGPEAELPLMAPGQVLASVSRIRSRDARTPRHEWRPGSLEGLRALAAPAAVNHAASAFAPGSVDVLCYASTSSAYAIGHEAESRLVRQLGERWGTPVCSASMSAVTALRSIGIARIALVHPPWFGDVLNHLGAGYFRGRGFEVAGAHLADLPHDPDQIEPAMAADWIEQHISDNAEAVVIGGNGFRVADAIDELENRLGRPVLEANQVLLWSLLASAGVPSDVRGFGKLLNQAILFNHAK